MKLLADKFESEEDNNEGRQESNNSARSESNTESSSSEQTRSVHYIKNCKDYYEILNVSKSATEIEIKKQYRKLALQFHPDKNKSPGAAEAFKAIGNAFAVLSDPEKRRKYDHMGHPDNYEGIRRRQNGYDYTRGYEEEINPEEIFNMFFGGGFPSRNVYMYRSAPMYQRASQESQASSGYTVLLQIMPILLFICISLLSTFVPDNPYSLTRSK